MLRNTHAPHPTRRHAQHRIPTGTARQERLQWRNGTIPAHCGEYSRKSLIIQAR
ncbi:hypothetical protein BIFANG_02447 [Bifidobacterium angulatum DSM 20098 = JCM 7096]|uniref:Uncharacterized protein n=1 Tax=Bifidobacterium angulatum DSM 20098 = JCM 7096 TaxID=518635 RepID=C4FDQ9_9BIFI|nr:hypothetical protein BIFANG_02447 [Bifidobacterium angulatum DSM 20098 = JCM 7096]